jgi:hypothetical protein
VSRISSNRSIWKSADMPKSKLSVSLYLLLVFLSGALVGGFASRLYMTRSVVAAPRPEEWRRRYVDEMRTRVKMDSQQVAQLQQILDETRQKYHQLKEQEKPLAQAIHDAQVARIRGMLREDQRPLYDQLRAERDRRRQELEKKQDDRH